MSSKNQTFAMFGHTNIPKRVRTRETIQQYSIDVFQLMASFPGLDASRGMIVAMNHIAKQGRFDLAEKIHALNTSFYEDQGIEKKRVLMRFNSESRHLEFIANSIKNLGHELVKEKNRASLLEVAQTPRWDLIMIGSQLSHADGMTLGNVVSNYMPAVMIESDYTCEKTEGRIIRYGWQRFFRPWDPLFLSTMVMATLGYKIPKLIQNVSKTTSNIVFGQIPYEPRDGDDESNLKRGLVADLYEQNHKSTIYKLARFLLLPDIESFDTSSLQQQVSPKQILMCYEMDNQYLEPIQRTLQGLDHNVEVARDGRQAIERLGGDKHYDLVISGIAVKGRSNVARQREYIKELGQISKRRKMPVILESCVVDTDQIAQITKSGMELYTEAWDPLHFLNNVMSKLGYKVKQQTK